MGKYEEALEKLKVAVNGGQEFFERAGNLPSEYITENVSPPLLDTLDNLYLRIKEHHKVDEPKSKENNLIIHYTTISALVSMFQDASNGAQKSFLRPYDSIHLNDPDEGEYFVRNLNLPKKYDWLGKREVSHAYIVSFILPDNTKNTSDNLVFWQAYGEKGTGCSLSLPVSPALSKQLQKVLYGKKKVKFVADLLRPTLDSLDPLVRIHNQKLREDVREKLAEVVWQYLEKIRYLYKSEAYDYENECRVVVAESEAIKDKINFEDQKQNNDPAYIRHYYEHETLELQNLFFTGSSITIGPTVSYPQNIKYYLQTLLEQANLYVDEIKISEISYRKP